MFAAKSTSFSVNIQGETTFESYPGKFTVKQLLNHDEQLEVDRLRRQILGDKPDQASARALNQAEIFASLIVRVTEAPTWWKESNAGQGLYDDNVIAGVYGEAMKAEREYRESLSLKAKDAQKDLEKLGKNE